MADVTVKDLEDYLTGKLSGITVVDEQIEFPKDQKAIYIEGENDYLLEEDAKGTYVLKDGSGEVKLEKGDDSLDTFLQRIIRLIANEEADFDL